MSVANEIAEFDRPNKRNGRAAVEHRCDELGAATGTHASAQAGTDGSGRFGRRSGRLLAEYQNACEKMHGVDAYRADVMRDH